MPTSPLNPVGKKAKSFANAARLARDKEIQRRTAEVATINAAAASSSNALPATVNPGSLKQCASVAIRSGKATLTVKTSVFDSLNSGGHPEKLALDAAIKELKALDDKDHRGRIDRITKVNIYTHFSPCETCRDEITKILRTRPDIQISLLYSDYWHFDKVSEKPLYGNDAKFETLITLDSWRQSLGDEKLNIKITNESTGTIWRSIQKSDPETAASIGIPAQLAIQRMVEEEEKSAPQQSASSVQPTTSTQAATSSLANMAGNKRPNIGVVAADEAQLSKKTKFESDS